MEATMEPRVQIVFRIVYVGLFLAGIFVSEFDGMPDEVLGLSKNGWMILLFFSAFLVFGAWRLLNWIFGREE
jgi:hypothetical protein